MRILRRTSEYGIAYSSTSSVYLYHFPTDHLMLSHEAVDTGIGTTVSVMSSVLVTQSVLVNAIDPDGGTVE